METAKSKPEAKVVLDRESITFTRTDGLESKVSLIDDILANGDDAHGAILWTIMMKLTELAELGHAQLAALQAIANVATTPPELPDPTAQISKVFESMGLDGNALPAMMKAALQQTGAPGVDFTQETEQG
ncbi:MAG: hypothetical protein WBG86_06285 [Polyangiales bacterium]